MEACGIYKCRADVSLGEAQVLSSYMWSLKYRVWIFNKVKQIIKSPHFVQVLNISQGLHCMEDKRPTHVETQICFFVVPFFNLTTKLGFMCLCSFSRQSFVKRDMKSKPTWALQIWTMCLIRQSKLVFALSWQIQLKFLCSLKSGQSIWSLRQHNKAIL